jgi:hypothetical protein
MIYLLKGHLKNFEFLKWNKSVNKRGKTLNQNARSSSSDEKDFPGLYLWINQGESEGILWTRKIKTK